DRRLRTRGPARRQDHDVQAAQTHPHRRPLRPARARPARPQPMETTARDPRLLRHQPVERARRSDQWTPRAPARHRPGLPESDPLHLAVPDPFRPAPRTHQRTLKPEEPLISAALVLVPVLRPVGLTALLAAGVTGMTAGAVTLIGTAAYAESRSDYLLGRAEVPDTTTLLASLTAGPGAGLALGAAIGVSVAALAGVYLAVPGRLRIPPARLVTAALAGV